MSVSRNEMDESVDYADFAYDQLLVQTSQDSTGNGTLLAEFQPLAQQGGLRPNQVAELAFVELDVSGPAAEATGTDTEAFEHRGVFGINLDEGDDISSQSTGENAENTTVIQGSFINFETAQVNEPGVLIPFRVTNTEPSTYQRDWRSLTGRGPVLDANDSLDVIVTAISEATNANDFSITAHVVYDIFEIDDARTEFSLPT